MQIPIASAIDQLRDQLREAILEKKDRDIVFTPNSIELELSVTFKAEATAKGGLALLAFLNLSAEAQTSGESLHKIKLSLSVADKNGNTVKIRSDDVPPGLRD